jgi:hypothetical protein
LPCCRDTAVLLRRAEGEDDRVLAVLGAEVVTPLLQGFEKEHPGWKVQMEQLTWQSGLEKITGRGLVGQRARSVRDGLDVDATHAGIRPAQRLEHRRRRSEPRAARLELCSVGGRNTACRG